MNKQTIGWLEIVRVFLWVGARSFGGWSTAALLLERELVTQRNIITKDQLQGAVTYAQILPGATQTAIASGVGYRLRGIRGALLATISYLLPALSLITVFAVVYFHFIQGPQLIGHLSGLIAALGGIILANAYHLGKRHVAHPVLWLLVVAAFAAKLWLGINAVIIILLFGVVGLILSMAKSRSEQS